VHCDALGQIWFFLFWNFFAECPTSRARQNMTVGDRRHGPPKFCRAFCFAKFSLPSVKFCRVRHSAKYCFAECPDKNTQQSVRHSAKSWFLVVNASTLTCDFPFPTRMDNVETMLLCYCGISDEHKANGQGAQSCC
jgi:hypothetical protein